MIESILIQMLIALPLIIGAYLTLSLLKLPDFSLESAYLFGAVTAFLSRELPLPLVFLAAMGGGILVGLTVSLLNQVLQLPFLLSAIITNGCFHGLTQFLLESSIKSFRLVFPVSELMVVSGVGVILLILIAALSRSQLGYSWAVYGNNPLFFKQHHLNGSYVAFSGILCGHACAGLSGFLFAQSNGFVDLMMNFGVVLLCLTSLMLGKLAIPSKRPQLLIPLVGLTTFFVIQQSLLRLGLDLKYFNAFQAICIFLVLYAGRRKHSLSFDHLGV